MNPAKYLYLRTNGFARALAPDYPRKRGYILEADDYSRVLDGCQALSEALASVGREWKPRDMIDLHTLLWFHLGEREDRKRRKAAKAVIPSAPIGVPYVEADETTASAEANPFSIDPEKVDRANRAHRATQNRLAAFLRGRGLVPLAPRPGDPEYDVAWWYGETLFVAEIKSTTELNSEKQLRLGLGHVLRYQHLLSERVPSVKAVLVPESEPDGSWQRFCSSLKVVLAWPGDFAHLGFLEGTTTAAS